MQKQQLYITATAMKINLVVDSGTENQVVYFIWQRVQVQVCGFVDHFRYSINFSGSAFWDILQLNCRTWITFIILAN